MIIVQVVHDVHVATFRGHTHFMRNTVLRMNGCVTLKSGVTNGVNDFKKGIGMMAEPGAMRLMVVPSRGEEGELREA